MAKTTLALAILHPPSPSSIPILHPPSPSSMLNDDLFPLSRRARTIRYRTSRSSQIHARKLRVRSRKTISSSAQRISLRSTGTFAKGCTGIIAVAVEAAGALNRISTCRFYRTARRRQKIVGELDHRMLVRPNTRPSTSGPANEVEITFEERRWVFPAKIACLLPVKNTTAERLAWWIAGGSATRCRPGIAAGHVARH